MKRILFLIGTLGGGGAEKVLVNLANELCERGHEVTVEVLYGGGVYHSQLNKQIKQIVVFKKGAEAGKNHLSSLIYKVMRKLMVLAPAKMLHMLFIRSRGYDVEIAFLEGMSTKIISGGHSNMRKYAFVHANPLTYGYSTYSFRNMREEIGCYKKYEKIFCVSETVRLAFEEKYHILADVMYNAIDDADIVRKAAISVSAPVMNLKDVDRHTFRLISVGRLIKVKGYERLIRVIGKLKKEGYMLNLTILGDGELWNELEELLNKEETQGAVTLAGFVENPYPYIKDADLFVCSSLSEGWSLVVCEAIILETPVLVTKCGGSSEIVGDSGCGVICDNSEEGIYVGIKAFLDGKIDMNKMRLAARKRKEIFSMKNSVNQFEQTILQNSHIDKRNMRK